MVAMTCTIFENIYNKTEPHYISISDALNRIKTGRSRDKVEEIRNAIDKEKQDALKRNLPSVCFSGKFTQRYDQFLIEHSGFLVLDFDDAEDLDVLAADLGNREFVYAMWLSPRGNGIKALIRLADGKKHRGHFAALKEIFPTVDKSGVNESRVCYESYDPNIYINENAKPFTKTTVYEKITERNVVDGEADIFKKLLKWISNKGGAFVTGERNSFIFKLGSACCRFGIHEDSAVNLILSEYPATNDFTSKEAATAIKSAYRANKSHQGSAIFEKEVLINKATRKEIEINEDVYNEHVAPKDVIYGAHVKSDALNIFHNGYPSIRGLGIPALDAHYKAKKGEITCLTGIGNYGKSTLYKWMTLMRVLLFGEKFCSYSPEDNPPEEYYHDFVEMLLGCDCTPANSYRPPEQVYINAYDFVSSHIFYIYPKDLIPSVAYIKERFLELIIKEKISGAAIDPFNQLAHDYGKSGGRSDKYLETVLADFGRFAQDNDIYLTIVAHPTKLPKQANGNYSCPDVFDIADGAMWNNKMDNILVYHRPFMQTDPTNRICEFHSKKIRKQKTVGKKGFIEIEYARNSRRYEVDRIDHMSKVLRENELSFNKPVINYVPINLQDAPF